ncbi:MAG: hypothetical protein K6F69_06085 [Treponema sp.]|nr:hypothetical protein [Treponema sp.]
MRDKEITMVVPDLTKREATQMEKDIINMKSKVAPKAKATVAVGKASNFTSLMERVRKGIGD